MTVWLLFSSASEKGMSPGPLQTPSRGNSGQGAASPKKQELGGWGAVSCVVQPSQPALSPSPQGSAVPCSPRLK